MDLYELNEAFAAQSLAVVKELGIDSSKVIVEHRAKACHTSNLDNAMYNGTSLFKANQVHNCAMYIYLPGPYNKIGLV